MDAGNGEFDSELDRRRYLLAAGTPATLGLAGCSEVASREFEATPVRLPEAARRELRLAETPFDSDTVTREPDVGDIGGEVTITSHAGTYQRGPARGIPTVMKASLSGVNVTFGAGAAIVATDADERQWLMTLRSLVPNLVARYGESFGQVLGTGVVVAVVCGLTSRAFDLVVRVEPDGELASVLESIYFSALTFTTLGYGDFRPADTVGQFLTVAKITMGVILLAVLNCLERTRLLMVMDRESADSTRLLSHPVQSIAATQSLRRLIALYFDLIDSSASWFCVRTT